jgi:hypothetical protein
MVDEDGEPTTPTSRAIFTDESEVRKIWKLKTSREFRYLKAVNFY